MTTRLVHAIRNLDGTISAGCKRQGIITSTEHEVTLSKDGFCQEAPCVLMESGKMFGLTGGIKCDGRLETPIPPVVQGERAT